MKAQLYRRAVVRNKNWSANFMMGLLTPCDNVTKQEAASLLPAHYQ